MFLLAGCYLVTTTTPENTSVDESERIPKTAIGAGLRYLEKQSFTNVLLAAILGSIGWFLFYILTVIIPVEIPKHLKQIQEGYQSIQVNDAVEREKDRAQTDKWLDRIDRQNGVVRGK